MGCDYYIDKDLVIYYINDNRREYINLEHKRGYFYDINIDSDHEDYDKEEEESIKKQLMPSMEPILIYKNNSFSKPIFEEKYKNFIIQNLPENKTWTDIKKIMKKESRYERE